MMSNLFAMRADLSSPEMKQWQNEYLQVEKTMILWKNYDFNSKRRQGRGLIEKGSRKAWPHFLWNLFTLPLVILMINKQVFEEQ